MTSPARTSSIEGAVLYRDDRLLIVNKPSGVPVQSDLTGDVCLLDMLRAAYGPNVGLVHRLDRPVSGAMVFSLDPPTLAALSEAFRSRRVHKTYWAVVEGSMEGEGELRHTLQHDQGRRKAVVREGEEHVLRHRCLVKGDRYTLIEVEPMGGAFHQIRAQLAAAGHPVRGDVKYGARRGERDRSIALHARRIAFAHPLSGDAVEAVAPLPPAPIWRSLLNDRDADAL
jgi:23S rRNA pseudouridine1911/1915/1917 synthase